VHIHYKFSKNIIKCNNIFNNNDAISYRRNACLAADVTFATERVMVPPLSTAQSEDKSSDSSNDVVQGTAVVKSNKMRDHIALNIMTI
jgi:hypothetical protein